MGIAIHHPLQAKAARPLTTLEHQHAVTLHTAAYPSPQLNQNFTKIHRPLSTATHKSKSKNTTPLSIGTRRLRISSTHQTDLKEPNPAKNSRGSNSNRTNSVPPFNSGRNSQWCVPPAWMRARRRTWPRDPTAFPFVAPF